MLKNELMRKPLEQQYFAIYRDHVPYTLFASNFYLFGVNLCVLTSSLHQYGEDLLTTKPIYFLVVVRQKQQRPWAYV